MNLASPYNSFTPCGMFPGTFASHLTPSRTAQGAGLPQPFQPGCFPPMWWPPFPPFFPVDSNPIAPQLDTVSSNNSALAGQKDEEEDEIESESQFQDVDHVTIHDEESKTMFAEFNPEIKQPNTWDPPKQMSAYLEKHFNKSLKAEEAEAILEDYPTPNCPAMRSKGLTMRSGSS